MTTTTTTTTHEPDTDVVVIGAGLAGLRCATGLMDAGLDVVVLEAGDAVGGRIRTDRVDGHLLDRGFQVLNPSYPRVRDDIDVAALGLQSFGRGAGVMRDGGRSLVADPLRHPGRLADTLRSGFVTPASVIALARWAAPALGPVERLVHTDRAGWHETLDAAGVRGPVRDELFERFLAGVILEDDGSSASAYVRLLVRSFALATPGLPTDGMAALPAQLADRLGDRVLLDAPALSVRTSGGLAVVHTAAGALRARQVVVAVGGQDVAGLVDLPAVATKGLVTWWFSTTERPTDLDMLILDARHDSGGLVNTAVVSNAAPSYAPAGRHLVQATAVTSLGVPTDEQVRARLASLYATDTSRWDLLARHDVEHSLPVQPAGRSLREPVELDATTVVCGDHRDTASIQGALASGARTAEVVRARLRA